MTDKTESWYIFTDLTGHCFENFAKINDHTAAVIPWMKDKGKLDYADMVDVRYDLIKYGFVQGLDFNIQETN